MTKRFDLAMYGLVTGTGLCIIFGALFGLYVALLVFGAALTSYGIAMISILLDQTPTPSSQDPDSVRKAEEYR